MPPIVAATAGVRPWTFTRKPAADAEGGGAGSTAGGAAGAGPTGAATGGPGSGWGGAPGPPAPSAPKNGGPRQPPPPIFSNQKLGAGRDGPAACALPDGSRS